MRRVPLFPLIAAFLTGHHREEVVAGRDFKWSRNSLTYNLFRAFEVIFWRKEGIRCEAALAKINGKYQFLCFTLEAFAVHHEALLRTNVKNLWRKIPRLIRVPTYAPSFAGMPSGPKPIGWHFAIAYDTTANLGDVSSTNLTVAYTVTGSNPLLVVGAVGNNSGGGGNNLTGATYGGASMTQVDSISYGTQTSPGGSDRQTVDWILPGCATGSNNVVITASGGNNISGGAMSYSGCKQTVQPDSHNTATQGTNSSTFSCSTTVVAANCWLTGFASEWGGTTSAGSGTTLRCSFYMYGFDSNGTVGTGSQSLNFNGSTSNTWRAQIMSIAPAANVSTRGATVNIMNGASRFATASYHLAITWARSASVTIMNAASRYATASWSELIVWVRSASVSMMNAASRYAKATKALIIKISSTIRWGFWTFD